MESTLATPKLPYIPQEQPPPTIFAIKCHLKADEVCPEVDKFFLKHWSFESQREKDSFIRGQYGRWPCLAMPMAHDERILDLCILYTLFYLLDDLAESMTVEEGKKFYKRLIAIAKGKTLPNRNNPSEWITYDIFASMRACDEELTDVVLQGVIVCVTAQVDEARTQCTDMGAVLRQKTKEAGAAFVTAGVKYGQKLRLSPEALESVRAIEGSYAKLAVTVNDVHSFDKELRQWNAHRQEGARLVNMVNMLARETGVSYQAAKRVLWVLIREWELEHQQLVSDRMTAQGGCDADLEAYLKVMEYAMSGNERWSETTGRYHSTD